MYYYGRTRRRSGDRRAAGILGGAILAVVGCVATVVIIAGWQSDSAFAASSPLLVSGTPSACYFSSYPRSKSGGYICTITYAVNGTTYSIMNRGRFNTVPSSVTVYYEPGNPSVAQAEVDYTGREPLGLLLLPGSIALILVGCADVAAHILMKRPASD